MKYLALFSLFFISVNLSLGQNVWHNVALPGSHSTIYDYRPLATQDHLFTRDAIYAGQNGQWDSTGTAAGGYGFGGWKSVKYHALEINGTLYTWGEESEFIRKEHPDSAWEQCFYLPFTAIQGRGKPIYHDGMIFIGGLFGLYASADGGDTWLDYNNESRNGFDPTVWAMEKWNDTLVVYGQRRGASFSDKIQGIFKIGTSDTSWTVMHQEDVREGTWVDMTVSQDRFFLANNEQVYRLKEDQSGWDSISVPFKATPFELSTMIGKDSLLFVGTTTDLTKDYSGAYYSKDLGETWSFVNTSGMDTNGQDMKWRFTDIQDDTVYVIMSGANNEPGAIYKSSITNFGSSGSSGGNDTTDTSDTTTFITSVKPIGPGVYPNPCNEKLHFSVAHHGKNYKLVDLTGQVMMEGKLEENTLNVSMLKEGIYLMQIGTDVQRIVKSSGAP